MKCGDGGDFPALRGCAFSPQAYRYSVMRKNVMRSGRTLKEIEHSMQLLGRKSFAGLATAILATTCFGFAAGRSHKASEHSTDVTFARTAKFKNGDTLPAGTYYMKVPENSQTPDVTFYKDGKVVATVKAKVVPEQRKNEDTVVDSVTQGNAEEVTAIRPSGWEEEILFGSEGH